MEWLGPNSVLADLDELTVAYDPLSIILFSLAVE